MQTLFIIPGACSFGSMAVLDLLGKPYQIGITTAEIRATPEFRAINPLGKVGSLKDGDNLIYENAAILLYLADKNPDSKIGLALNSHERVEAYKWLSYLSSTLHAAFGPLFNPAAFADADFVEQFKQKVFNRLKDTLSYVDSYLSKNKYFISNKLTLVDLQAFGLLRWSEKFGILQDYPAIADFINRLSQLPEVSNAINIEQQKTDKLVNSSFAGYYTFGK